MTKATAATASSHSNAPPTSPTTPTATIDQAVELWGRLARPNVMIKVPATNAGILAIEELTTRGVNVNVTLLFSIARYEQVIDAYIAGIERRAATDEPDERDRLSRVVLRGARGRQGRPAASDRFAATWLRRDRQRPPAPTPATSIASTTNAGF